MSLLMRRFMCLNRLTTSPISISRCMFNSIKLTGSQTPSNVFTLKPISLNTNLMNKKNYSTEANEVQKRIDQLVKKSTVVLFIKGS